jgi:hypothetical protein
MRRSVLEEVGFLIPEFHGILDHSLWVRIAARRPLLHVPEYWAVERTHETAKTTAQATMFVDEAFRFIPSMEKDPLVGKAFAGHRDEIYAGLNVFAGRRYIDAGQPRQALGFFWRAFRLHPASVLHYWFKVVQALGGALGLGGLFLVYRNLRRKLQHHGRRLQVTETGIGWVSE